MHHRVTGPAPVVEGTGDLLAVVNSALETAWALTGERRVRSLVAVGGLAIKGLELASIEERLSAIEGRLKEQGSRHL